MTTEPINLLDGTIIATITPTLFEVRLIDGREMQAVLCPDLRHIRLRVEKTINACVGKMVRVELNPFSSDKCRVMQFIRE